ncbi:serine/threonine protein phosphatase 1 [Altererythrobacter atlanticus]|uniref:Serine/threonine-protein phosphatase 1 n=1 Tax=Croceibacterium atlanticum TaxID=1267766 RepID=A0A0F7KVK5_9SPHN|nr:metallophosphoesterase [Croceibacterium atlanticum]AKH42790.1 Serine/threonine-protein phosphatase 1 [Croceibacterium atlanticum]MBB5731570.1 serine/threonine protein phosphatase 1 [Croceibacterium atlanticum]
MLGLSRNRVKTAQTAAGERVYAIGDVHGCHALLRRLIEMIVEDCERGPRDFDHMRIIFLGDLIDRGPSSGACLQLVHDLVAESGSELILGNHEDMMLESIRGNPAAQRAWLANGGDATLYSYGVSPPSSGEDSFDFADRLARAVPEHIVGLLETAATQASSGDYLFVHAGVRPGVPLKQQDPLDLYSIREEFTHSADWHGAMVVHGHSMVDDVEVYPNRIACDTGAYRTGKLSCICVQDRDLYALTT